MFQIPKLAFMIIRPIVFKQGIGYPTIVHSSLEHSFKLNGQFKRQARLEMDKDVEEKADETMIQMLVPVIATSFGIKSF